MKVRFLALLLAVLVVVGACGDDDETDDAADTSAQTGEIETIASGKLTVCTDFPYAPFEFGDPGKEEGIDVELVRGVAKKVGLEAVFRDTDFDGIFAALKARQCDMIASSVSITDERKKENDFSDGYYEIHQSLLVRKGEEGTYKDLESLNGKAIGVQSETTGAEYAKENAKGASIREFTGADEMFAALKARQVDALLQDFPVNSYNAKTTGETVVSKRFDEAEAEEYGFVIPKGSTDLRDAVNKALRDLRDDGTYDTILKKYLGENASG